MVVRCGSILCSAVCRDVGTEQAWSATWCFLLLMCVLGKADYAPKWLVEFVVARWFMLRMCVAGDGEMKSSSSHVNNWVYLFRYDTWRTLVMVVSIQQCCMSWSALRYVFVLTRDAALCCQFVLKCSQTCACSDRRRCYILWLWTELHLCIAYSSMKSCNTILVQVNCAYICACSSRRVPAEGATIHFHDQLNWNHGDAFLTLFPRTSFGGSSHGYVLLCTDFFFHRRSWHPCLLEGLQWVWALALHSPIWAEGSSFCSLLK